jgi:phosphinothricin acetyltransferase
VYRRIGWKDGAWHDVGWWQLQLTDGAPATDPPGPPVRLD